MTDELRSEIERVVFEAHPVESRLGAATFRELLNLKAEPGRIRRLRAHEEMAEIAAKLESEREAQARLVEMERAHSQLEASCEDDIAARQGLILRGGENRARRHGEVNAAVTAAQARVDTLNRRKQRLEALAAEVENLSTRRLPSIKADLLAEHDGAELSEQEWSEFDVNFAGNPAAVIDRHLQATNTDILRVNGAAIPRPTTEVEKLAPFVAGDAILTEATLHALQAESWRLGQLIGLDAARTRQLNDLNTRITQAQGALESLKKQITFARGAGGRIQILREQRKSAYASLFDGYSEEQAQLADLYAPLGAILGDEEGTLGKLTFTVRRTVDAEAWAARGELLLDLRTMGGFRGQGELLRKVNEELLQAWTNGSSEEVARAMADFRTAHDQDLIAHARAPKSDLIAYRQWGADVAAWLNSTDHIDIQYGVQYDGLDIEQLSPGTRGIVLLLLYLSVDQLDDRPLVIDQPEENLDPKSIFDELVPRFRSARLRRQIIIVTHNANLVVNTDADQVIVANAGAHRPGQLPELTYTSGGLENSSIREQVCEILEGGRRAFEERARRLRFRL